MRTPPRYFALMVVTIASSSGRAEPMRPSTLAELTMHPTVSAETTYTAGEVAADSIGNWTARFGADVPVRDGVLLHADIAVVRAAS